MKLPPTQAELDKVTNAFETIQAAYTAGLIPLSQYDAAIDSFTKKMKSLEGAFLPANLPADVLGDALKAAGIQNATDQIEKLQEGVAAAGAAFDIGRIPASAYAAEIDKLTTAEQKNATDGITGLTAALSIAGENFATGKIGLDAYGQALDNLVQTFPNFQDAVNKQEVSIAGLNVTMATITQTVPNVDQILRSFGVETADDVTAHIKTLQAQLDAANQAMGLGVPGAAQAAQAAEHALLLEQQALSNSALDDKTLGIPNLQTLQQTLGDTNRAYQDLASGGMLNTVTNLQAMITQQNAAIAVAVQQGQDTTQLRIDLDSMKDSLSRATLGFSDMAASLKQVELSGIDTVFHDILFDIGSVGDAFKQLGENMVDVVVNRIIKDALTPLLTALDSVIAKGVAALEQVAGIGVPSIGSADSPSGSTSIPVPGDTVGNIPSTGSVGPEGVPEGGSLDTGGTSPDLSGEAGSGEVRPAV